MSSVLIRSETAVDAAAIDRVVITAFEGFRAEPSLRLIGVPPKYFQALAFDSAPAPAGEVHFDPAFNATE